MTNKKLFVVMPLALFQISCNRTPLQPQIIFTPEPTAPVSSKSTAPVTAKTYKFTEAAQPVVIQNTLPATEPANRPQPEPLSPAIIALVTNADKNTNAGNLEAAVVNIERALRIKPRDATLTYKLAKLRLKQSKPRLAEDLARKSALLAGADTGLKKLSWLLIAQARRLQQNYEGEKEALLKAESLN